MKIFRNYTANNEYEKISDTFKMLSQLFIKYLFMRDTDGNEIYNETMEETKIKHITESEEADGIIKQIKQIMTKGTHNEPSLLSRVKAYTNNHANQLMEIEKANPLTQMLILSMVQTFQAYIINIKNFDNEDDKIFVTELIDMLNGEAKKLNVFLFERKENPEQRQPLYTIYTDKNATELNSKILPEAKFPEEEP